MAERQRKAGEFFELSEEEAQNIQGLKRAPVSKSAQEWRDKLSGVPDNKLFGYTLREGETTRGVGRSLSFAAAYHKKKYVARGTEGNTLYFMLTPRDEEAAEVGAGTE